LVFYDNSFGLFFYSGYFVILKEGLSNRQQKQFKTMTEEQKSLPTWILIVSGIFALMELMVSVSLCISPESVLETVDFNAKGVDYVVYMWAARQFALGFIFAFATFKRSIPMLTIAYIFFLVMFVGDFFIGISQKENSLIISALVMCIVSSVMIFLLNKRK
jgi:hypothetical protein